MLALIPAPWLHSAPAHAAPIRIAKAPQETLPDAQELLDNLWAPYESARTFRGNFVLNIKADNNAISQIRLDSRFRRDEQGKLNGQFDTLYVVGSDKPKTRQTFVFTDENQAQKLVLVEQKVWWIPAERESAPAVSTFVKSIVDGIVQALENDDDFVPVVSRSVASGKSILVLKSRKGNAFRATLDEQTRALLSFDVKNNISIVASNQTFDALIADSDLVWNTPADYRQVAEGEVMPPASLGITIPGLASVNGAVN